MRYQQIVTAFVSWSELVASRVISYPYIDEKCFFFFVFQSVVLIMKSTGIYSIPWGVWCLILMLPMHSHDSGIRQRKFVVKLKAKTKVLSLVLASNSLWVENVTASSAWYRENHISMQISPRMIRWSTTLMYQNSIQAQTHF